MAITPVVLAGGLVVGSTSGPVYTAPAGVHARVGATVFTNSNSAAATLTVSVQRSGGASLPIIAGITVQPGQAYVSPELFALVLNPGDAVTATASVNVACQMSGLTF